MNKNVWNILLNKYSINKYTFAGLIISNHFKQTLNQTSTLPLGYILPPYNE